MKNKSLSLDTRFKLTDKGKKAVESIGFKFYIKKPVKVKAIQLTQEMVDNNTPPGECLINAYGEFTLATLEGLHTAPVGAWYVEGNADDCWFIQDHIFKKNYVEA